MTITQDWQGELTDRSFLFGRGTNYPGIGGIDGLGLIRPEYTDTPRGYLDGVGYGRDRVPTRIITIPMTVLGDTDDEVWTNYRALAVAWRPARTGELALDLRIPGAAETLMRVYGRPLDVPARLQGLKGRLETVAAFRCGDPMFYGAEQSSGVKASSPYSITDTLLGDDGADTDRVTITINGNGGTPSLTNATQGFTLAFNQTLAGGQSYVLDLHNRVVSKNGVTTFDHLTAGFRWFSLTGGTTNQLQFSGCASIEVTWRAAYWTP